MTAISRIGILGLGKMGAPMAGHLLARGYSVAGYDPLEPARRNARALGVSVCETPREVAGHRRTHLSEAANSDPAYCGQCVLWAI